MNMCEGDWNAQNSASETLHGWQQARRARKGYARVKNQEFKNQQNERKMGIGESQAVAQGSAILK